MELFPSNSNVNFMRLRHVTLGLTAFICVSALVLLATKGFNFALDFTGGTATELKFEQPVDVEQVRERLEAAGFEGAVVQTFGSGNDIVVRLQPEEVVEGKPALWIVDKANNTVSLRPVEVLSFETGAALVSGGIEEGETYVADGTKLLRPGQTVAASEGAAQ